MEHNKASMTAIVSAFGRAYHSKFEEPKIFDDFLAEKMITEEEFLNISKHMAGGIDFFNPKEAYLYKDEKESLKWVIETQVAPTPLARSAYAEDMLDNFIKLGGKQYIILGAGLDTFAFRKPDILKHIKVFELDHPNTQELKRSRIETLGFEINNNLSFVSVDFSKDNFTENILKSSYNPEDRSFFSWLGVTYYLTRDEIKNTLKSIAKICPKGSTVVFDYADEDIFNEDKVVERVKNMVKLTKASGEPMKTGYDYLTLEKDLEECGFLIYEHLTPKEIEERYFKDRNDYYHAFENINYVLAVVR